MKRGISTTFEKLLEAVEVGTSDVIQYLNIETGEIAMKSDEFESFDEDGNIIEEPDLFFKDEKYIQLPTISSREEYKDMERFLETLENTGLQELLFIAVNGKEAFRKFKHILMNHSKEKKLWLKFHNECVENRVLEWLKKNKYEIIE